MLWILLYVLYVCICAFCISIFTHGMLLADLRHNAPLSLRGTFVFRGCSLQLLHICTCTAFRHCAHVHIGEKTVHSGDKRVHMYTVEKSLYTVHSEWRTAAHCNFWPPPDNIEALFSPTFSSRDDILHFTLHLSFCTFHGFWQDV